MEGRLIRLAKIIHRIVTLPALIIAAAVQAQPPVSLSEHDFDGLRIESAVTYPADGLWGYINGGADLYLEYGFESLISQRIAWQGQRITVDIYRMSSEKAAFGIFSVQRFRCLKIYVFTDNDCLTSHQYLAAKGPYLVSIVNTVGNTRQEDLTLTLASKLMSKIPDSPLQVPILFSQEMLQPFVASLKMAVGPLGIQNGFPFLEPLLAGFDGFTVWAITVTDDFNKGNLVRIEFANKPDFDRFLSLNSESTPYQTNKSGFTILADSSRDSLSVWVLQGQISPAMQSFLSSQ